MGIKALLLERLTKRKQAADTSGALKHSLPSAEKFRVLAALVNDTVLPRRISLSGLDKTLEMTAAEQRLFTIACRVGGETLVERENLSPDVPSSDIGPALAAFLSAPGDCIIEFSDVDAASVQGEGLSAGVLLVEPELRGGSAPEQEDESTAGDTQVGQDAAAHIPGVPYELLTALEGNILKSRYFVTDGHPVPDTLTGGHAVVDASEFSGMGALYEKLAAPLGPPLLFVALAQGPKQETFAFAMDGREGVAIELSRQRLGAICQAWNKIRDK